LKLRVYTSNGKRQAKKYFTVSGNKEQFFALTVEAAL
jgi:hypothetical protein